MRKQMISVVVVILFCLLQMEALTASAQKTPLSNSLSPELYRSYVIVSNDDSWKYSPNVAYNSTHDEFMVVWENIWPGNLHDIYARRVSNLGTLLGSEFVVATGTKNYLQPSIAYDSLHDQYLVTYSYDFNGDGSDTDIMGRFLPGNGSAPTDTEFGIETSLAQTSKPRVVYDVNQDKYLVVWKTEGPPSYIGGGFMFDTKAGVTVNISSATADEDFPDVTYNQARDEFVVVWDVLNSGTNLDVSAVRLDWKGDKMTPGEFVVANNTFNEQRPSVAACSAADQYMFVSQQVNDTSTDDNIFTRWMSGAGALSQIQGAEGTTLPQRFPRITCNPAGTRYYLIWQDQYAQPLLRWGIWAAEILPDKTFFPAFEVVRPSDDRDRLYPALAVGRHAALAVWQHARDDSGYLDIWGQILGTQIFLPIVAK